MFSSLKQFVTILIISLTCFAVPSVFAASDHHSNANKDVDSTTIIHSNESASEHAKEHDVSHEEPTIVDHMMHHISDANEFHIFGHIHLPLPVIIYNKATGMWSFGMSSDYKEAKDGLILSHGRIVDATSHKADQLIDLSITKNVFSMLMATVILTVVFFSVKKAYEKRSNAVPKGLQSILEPIIAYIVDDVAKPNLGKHYERFLPYLLSIFFFILINNLIGLIPFFPGSANVSGNIAFTLTLAVFTFILTNVNGTKDYWKHIFAMPGVPKLVLIILTPLELIGLITKPFALTMRLFANITAGHIIILSLVSLIFILGKNGQSIGGVIGGAAIAVPFVLFMNALELFVAFLQAYIFTLLSAIFIGMALEEHHHEEAHH
jgi:F-type H+-transporting ATPase subunit a